MTTPFPKRLSIGEKHAPAMDISDQRQADDYFERCVQHSMEMGLPRLEAESLERTNLGYYAGYYGEEIRERVERLFRCQHPVFGAINVNGPPSPESAFQAGVEMAQKSSP